MFKQQIDTIIETLTQLSIIHTYWIMVIYRFTVQYIASYCSFVWINNVYNGHKSRNTYLGKLFLYTSNFRMKDIVLLIEVMSYS